ncbi:hypothetical protein PybrP1_011006, partial [[Pythium] brassicae (nom. inval.)]
MLRAAAVRSMRRAGLATASSQQKITAGGGNGDKSGGDNLFEELKQKLQALSGEALAVLEFSLPAGSGFAVGFL